MSRTKNTTVLFITLRADIGGGPEHLYQLLSNIGNSVEPIVACPKDKPYHERFALLVGDCNLISVPHRSFNIETLLRLATVIKERNVAVIHSHGKGAGLYARLLAAMTKRPCVHTFHGIHTGEYGLIKKHLYVTLERLMGLATDVAICVSRGERELVERIGLVSRVKIRTIENGVAIPTERAPVCASPALNIVAVNRYDHQKNPGLLLDIAAQLAEVVPAVPFKLTVIGEGESLSACRQAVRERGLDSLVDLKGATLDPRAFYRDADVFVSTSRWEGMPLAVLEAMSEGLPVVATDVVGNRDIVTHGENGYLFESENAEAGAEALRLLCDGRVREKFGSAARALIQRRFSVAVMAARTADIYFELAPEWREFPA